MQSFKQSLQPEISDFTKELFSKVYSSEVLHIGLLSRENLFSLIVIIQLNRSESVHDLHMPQHPETPKEEVKGLS